MITPLLEKLILFEGAQWRNFCAAYSAVFTLLVPKGKYIIIESLSLSTPRAAPYDASDISIIIESDKTRDVFLFPGAAKTNGFAHKADVFSSHYTDVRFRLSLISNFIGTDFAVLPQQAAEPAAPGGYGVTVPVDQFFSFDAGTEAYFPQNQKYTAQPVQAGMRNEPFPDIGVMSLLPAATSAAVGINLNAGYVIINQAKNQVTG